MIDRFEELAGDEREWDGLAVAGGQPLCRPAWLRSWWNAHCATADRPSRALRVALVRHGAQLSGVVPLFLVDRGSRLADMRMLGDGRFWSLGPVLDAAAAEEAIACAAQALSATAPRPARLIFANIPREARWPRELARHWPTPVVVRRSGLTESLVIRGGETYSEWLAARPRDWRANLRRRGRRAAEQGFQIRCAQSVEELYADFTQLARLHHARWQGNSSWLLAGMEDAIAAAAGALAGAGGLRIWSLRRDDELIGATLFACAGRTSQALVTAFHPSWRSLAPGLLTYVAGIRHQLEEGNETIDLGYGDYPYKRVLAHDRDPLARFELFPVGWRYPLARARWPSERVRRHIVRGGL